MKAKLGHSRITQFRYAYSYKYVRSIRILRLRDSQDKFEMKRGEKGGQSSQPCEFEEGVKKATNTTSHAGIVAVYDYAQPCGKSNAD
jgi:hypothetical protein